MTTTLINCRQLKLENQTWSKQSARELHCESKQLKPTKNKLTWCDFTTFSEQVFANSLDLRFRSFYALHIQNLLNSCQPKQNQSVSRILWISFFGGFLLFGWTVRELGCPSPDLTKKKTHAPTRLLFFSAAGHWSWLHNGWKVSKSVQSKSQAFLCVFDVYFWVVCFKFSRWIVS